MPNNANFDTNKVKRAMREWSRGRLDVAGQFVTGIIQLGTPVKFGFLREANGYKVLRYNHLRVFNSSDYAPFVELGTGKFSTSPGSRKTPWVYKSKRGYFWTEGQRPNPFFRTGFNNSKQGVKLILGGSAV